VWEAVVSEEQITRNDFELELSGFVKGVYLVRVVGKPGLCDGKFLKE